MSHLIQCDHAGFCNKTIGKPKDEPKEWFGITVIAHAPMSPNSVPSADIKIEPFKWDSNCTHHACCAAHAAACATEKLDEWARTFEKTAPQSSRPQGPISRSVPNKEASEF